MRIFSVVHAPFSKNFGKVAKSRDMVEMAKQLLSIEKAWLLSQIGKWSFFRRLLSSAELLRRAHP